MVLGARRSSVDDLPALTLAELEMELDRQARAMLGISGEEFARRFHAGVLPETPAVEHLKLLLAVVRSRQD